MGSTFSFSSVLFMSASTSITWSVDLSIDSFLTTHSPYAAFFVKSCADLFSQTPLRASLMRIRYLPKI